MFRILLFVVGAIVVVLVAMAIIHALFWLGLIALVVAVAAMALGGFRVGRWSGRRRSRRF